MIVNEKGGSFSHDPRSIANVKNGHTFFLRLLAPLRLDTATKILAAGAVGMSSL